MYKNRVKNNRFFFWNSHSFILRTRKSSRKQSRKIQNSICYFEFSRFGFLRLLDKRAEISKKFLSFFTLFLYISWIGYLIIWSSNYWESRTWVLGPRVGSLLVGSQGRLNYILAITNTREVKDFISILIQLFFY